MFFLQLLLNYDKIEKVKGGVYMKIEFKDVTFKYEDDCDLLSNISFVINSDQMTSIIGPNGSGKSTITKLIMGILTPISGEIYINDELVTSENLNKFRANMGIIFQNPDSQFVGLTVKDDIAFGLENKRIERTKMLELIDKYSKLVHMNNYLDSNPENLSGGQKQRVAIAGVLAMETEMIIFDEATSMLDPIGVDEINKTLKMLKKQASKTIISITHNIEEILYSDNVLVINNGQIVAQGKPIDILSNFQILKDAGLDTIETVKLINLLKNSKYNKVVEELWKLTFNM